jgi:hypothetical protein
MKASQIVVVALAIAMVAFMFSASGFDALTQADPSGESPAVEAVNETAGTGPASAGELDTRGSGGGSLLEFVPSAPSFALAVLTIGLVIEAELLRMGAQPWLATPIGWTIQIVLSIGFVQFVLNRVFQ